MKEKLLLIGGGGHCHSVIDSLVAAGNFNEIGVVARDQENYNELLKDVQVSPFLVGIDKEIPTLYKSGWRNAFISLGSVGDTKGRKALYLLVANIGFEIPKIIDPSAIVSNRNEIQEGTYIGKNAVINAGCRIGTGVIINTGAIIEHDCHIGEFTHVSSGTTVCGQVKIGNNSHIGAGSVVRQQIIIGSNSIIGAGSVVVKDIPDNAKAYGNPCRVVE